MDFESPTSALAAVNELQAQGIQAQMARQAEQDPTNLYIANLPHSVKESDLESMFSAYGQVSQSSPNLHLTSTEVSVLSGHLHQDSERLKPAEQRSGVCEVTEGGPLSIFGEAQVFHHNVSGVCAAGSTTSNRNVYG